MTSLYLGRPRLLLRLWQRHLRLRHRIRCRLLGRRRRRLPCTRGCCCCSNCRGRSFGHRRRRRLLSRRWLLHATTRLQLWLLLPNLLQPAQMRLANLLQLALLLRWLLLLKLLLLLRRDCGVVRKTRPLQCVRHPGQPWRRGC